MGPLAGRTIMHFKDGSTLTDKDIYIHDLTEEQLADLTSVERVIRGWHLSILKSEIIKSFFIITENVQLLQLGGYGVGPPKPPIITMRALGCYLEDSDPPVKVLLSMDPRTYSVVLEASHVEKFRPDGFAKPLNPKKHELKRAVQVPVGPEGYVWSIINEPPVRRVFGTKEGLGCLIGVNDSQRALAEIKRSGNNCHLLIQPE